MKIKCVLTFRLYICLTSSAINYLDNKLQSTSRTRLSHVLESILFSTFSDMMTQCSVVVVGKPEKSNMNMTTGYDEPQEMY